MANKVVPVDDGKNMSADKNEKRNGATDVTEVSAFKGGDDCVEDLVQKNEEPASDLEKDTSRKSSVGKAVAQVAPIGSIAKAVVNDYEADQTNQSSPMGTPREIVDSAYPLAASLIATLVLMCFIIFLALVGGKAGVFMSQSLIADIAAWVIIDVFSLAQEFDVAKPNSSSLLQQVLRRCVGWLVIGAIRGGLQTVYSTTLVRSIEQDSWQPLPLVCVFVQHVILDRHLIAGVMMKASQDMHPSIWRWNILFTIGSTLQRGGLCTPYNVITRCGRYMVIATVTLGVAIMVKVVDRKSQHNDVKFGYRWLIGLGAANTLYFAIYIASTQFSTLPRSFVPIFKASVLVLFQFVIVRVIIPANKLAFGDTANKLWSYSIPAYMVTLEIGNTLLFLGTRLQDPEFWVLLALQEINSLLKNTGVYLWLFVSGRKTFGLDTSHKSIGLMEERRSVIAPCDNMGELVSPVSIMLVIAFESLFSATGIRPAPFLARTHIMDAWRARGSNTMVTRSETSLVLLFVLLIRFIFCWVEVALRNNNYFRGAITGGSISQSISHIEDRTSIRVTVRGAPPRLQSRRSSAMVLYDRIMRASDASEDEEGRVQHMKRMALGLLLMQPLALIFHSATLGQSMLIS